MARTGRIGLRSLACSASKLAHSASELRACIRYIKSDEGRFTTGGKRERKEMLDFCGQHNITADVEVILIQKVNEAYERLLKSDVKYRFSIDMASLKNE